MKCHFCNSMLDYELQCFNHKFIIRSYSYQICFDICDQYTLTVDKHHISVFDFNVFKSIIKIDNTFKITPDNAESVLLKLLSLKAFS